MARFIRLTGNEFYEAIIKPQFSDAAPADPKAFNGSLGEFTVMDDVNRRKPILNFKRVQNISQRRDASCDIIYKKVLGADFRFIDVDEWYSATLFCRNEFYRGDLEEFRSGDQYFFNKITPYFINAVSTDLVSNAYFGDISRAAPVNAAYSTTVYNGVFKWLKDFTAAGLIPAAQTLQIADGTNYNTTPAAAYNLLSSMYEKRPRLMRAFLPTEQEFEVSSEIYEGYQKYMLATGNGNVAYITDIATGREVPSFMGIPIKVQPFWTPIISDLKGSEGYAAVLTIRGNFVYGIDKSYGEGPNGNTAFELWYNQDEMTWKWRYFMRTGTAIGLPEHVVYAISAF